MRECEGGEGGEEKEETKIRGGEKEREEKENSSWEIRVVRRRILVFIAMWETAGRSTPEFQFLTFLHEEIGGEGWIS